MLTAERGAAVLTLEAYRRDLADFAAHLAGRTIEAASEDDVRAYLGRAETLALSPRTIARRLSALRQFFRFLLLDGVRDDDPTATIEGPRQRRSLPRTLTESEVGRLLDTAAEDHSPAGIRLAAIVELLYGSGLRVSELVGLPRHALRLGEPLLVKGKGGKERLVPLHDGARAAVAAWLAARPPHPGNGRYLFPSTAGSGHLTRVRCHQLLKDLAVKAGVDPKHLSAHVLRHAFASHLLAHGVDLMSLQRLLGHEDVATTEIYTHVEAERLEQLVAQHHPLARRGGTGTS